MTNYHGRKPARQNISLELTASFHMDAANELPGSCSTDTHGAATQLCVSLLRIKNPSSMR